MKTDLLVVTYLALISFTKIGVLSQVNDGTVVQIESGLIKGHILKSEKGKDYWAFQEIPYAEPPFGENRFQLPKLPKPWNGTLNATKNTKICYQAVSKYADLEISDDCLHINVYTPEKPGSHKLLPVLLWIHGGGFVAEAAVYQYYGPKYIMDHGIVVVSFNYRLGVFDLFQGAIMQSGSPVSSWSSGTNATAAAIDLVKSIDPTYNPKNTTDILSFYKGRMRRQFKQNRILYCNIYFTINLVLAGISGMSSSPSIRGGFQHFLNRDYKKVPVLIGFNSEEMVYAANGLNNTTLTQIDADPSVLISKSVNMSPHNRSIAGALYKNVYTNGSTFVKHPGGYIRHVSDSAFTTATCKQVELGSAHVPYYLYQFAYKGQLGQQMHIVPPPGAEKVGHAEDLHYMWDDGSNSDLNKFPKQDQLTLHRYVKMWTNFVKYLDPTPEADPLLENIRWLKSEGHTLRYLNINSTLTMQKHPRQYDQLKAILENYMEPPFDSFN